MITLRRGGDRGTADFGWLYSRHSFSFGHYYDPAHMGFGPLRVINEDKVKPGAGFGTHGHRDMEIISYVLEGELEHKDSIGNGSVIRPGDVQRMTAGTGIRHSEYNHSQRNPLHFLQIWIIPEREGLDPGYEQKHFTTEALRDRLRLVASADGREDSVLVHQDADLYIGRIAAGKTLDHTLAARRGAWIQIAEGSVLLDDTILRAGDGASTRENGNLLLEAREDAKILLFDMRL